MKTTFSFSEKLWKYSGEKAAWYFLTFDKVFSERVRAIAGKRTGWGQIKVEVTVGGMTWATSLFPGKEGVLVVPIKASVRKVEKLEKGSTVKGSFKIKGRL
jgi:hypothetical protein